MLSNSIREISLVKFILVQTIVLDFTLQPMTWLLSYIHGCILIIGLISIHGKVLGLKTKTMCNPKNEYVGNKTSLSTSKE